MVRIGVFYDGQYFYKVSNYYNYEHQRKARISISALHEFVRDEVSIKIGAERSLCQIVDTHYFRGRFRMRDFMESKQKLSNERAFDEVLMDANVVTHYLPLKQDKDGKFQEKGIDVWLALEAYELATLKKFDIVVLVACDGDYVPLVRKLNTIGTRVMLISWDFTYKDAQGKDCETRTSQQLLEEVAFPIAMHEIIDNRIKGKEASIVNLFLPQRISKTDTRQRIEHEYLFGDESYGGDYCDNYVENNTTTSVILSLHDGYGFIEDRATNNVFFHFSSLQNKDFSELEKGMVVHYTKKANPDLEKGGFLATEVWVDDAS
jgi:cold shock CspA family protein/uncharacterized LabA/DUF88 family protein